MLSILSQAVLLAKWWGKEKKKFTEKKQTL